MCLLCKLCHTDWLRLIHTTIYVLYGCIISSFTLLVFIIIIKVFYIYVKKMYHIQLIRSNYWKPITPYFMGYLQ